ncbi:hypothetical protein BC831DRAFT_462625 [Entophlyctis helioformis]|nr:hypothetical protein BC831DRAFT_462625 [Entophlyctis helioformis]
MLHDTLVCLHRRHPACTAHPGIACHARHAGRRACCRGRRGLHKRCAKAERQRRCRRRHGHGRHVLLLLLLLLSPFLQSRPRLLTASRVRRQRDARDIVHCKRLLSEPHMVGHGVVARRVVCGRQVRAVACRWPMMMSLLLLLLLEQGPSQ